MNQNDQDQSNAAAQQDAVGDPLADALYAGLRRLEANRTEQFDVPGWGGDLVVRVRKVTSVLLRPRAGADLEVVPGGWRGVAERMCNVELSTSEVILRCCDAGNPRAVESLVVDVDRWMTGTSTGAVA